MVWSLLVLLLIFVLVLILILILIESSDYCCCAPMCILIIICRWQRGRGRRRRGRGEACAILRYTFPPAALNMAARGGGKSLTGGGGAEWSVYAGSDGSDVTTVRALRGGSEVRLVP
ncbi:hypothetical protein T492DRAFT_185729 [Pavlovales sp. CCMP2436]|nr:hypothetical protein T492DRAFT_185729 [Pavlovales sp. CCMP2436]